MRTATGFDGNGFNVGDRVELHPRLDLWVRGARFGDVISISERSRRVKVLVDKTGRVMTGDEKCFRRVS
jgi:hypothetical protein